MLKKVKSASVGENSQNLIIHGDNLEALKALMPYYVGKIKCIYIDPPYNTGNENWVYNDNVNSPKIKKWIGKVVGSESEDLSRHDKWLCMMYPRLKLLHELLSEDGVIFISIDDNEYHNLKAIMNEIFLDKNFATSFIWKSRSSLQYSEPLVSSQTEYILMYCKNKNLWKQTSLKFNKTKKETDGLSYSNPDNDPSGRWTSSGLIRDDGRKKYTIITPSGKAYTEAWLYSKENMDKLRKENLLWFGKNGDSKPRKKSYWKDYSGRTSSNLLQDEFIFFEDENGDLKKKKLFTIGTTEAGTSELKDLFNIKRTPFDYPKPYTLVKYLLSLYPETEFFVLDSYAGTGTTGHAVLDLNKEDGGNRKFILVELEDKIAKDITAERVKRAIKKYGYNGGFEYCELDKPLFDENGQINKECTFEQLATYVYFTETNTNIDKNKISKEFIGEHNETEYYLLFDGIGNNTLDRDFLKKLEKNEKRKIIYADKCLIDDRTLEKNKIVFKQIPYEVKVY